MVKMPTSPPEGAEKPNPPLNVPSKQGVPPPKYDLLTPEGRDGLFADGFEALPACPDPLVVTAKAACDEHPECVMVTTAVDPLTPLGRAILEGGKTSDPGYEPPSRTNESSPDCVPITQTYGPEFLPPGERPGEAGGPFWDGLEFQPADLPPDFEGTIYEPYAIIEDMRALYTDFVDDVMDATQKLRSAALRWLCRVIALTLGSVVLILLAVGALGVVGAVGLFRVLDAAEYRYWAAKPEKHEPRERPWKK